MEWSWLKDWWRLKRWKRTRSVPEEDICYCDECFHNGDLDSCDGSESEGEGGKKVVVGVCAMAKKSQSKPMKEILTRLDEFEYIKMTVFPEEVILQLPVEEWPMCDCLISFHSKGFPLEKAIQYEKLRNPYVINNLHMQYDIQDRRKVYSILESEGIEIPRYAVLDRDSPDPKHHELVESEDHVEVNGVTFNKPFVEKPVSAEDHNIYIYYPTSAGGGSQRLFRKIGSRSSIYSPESRVRKTGSFIYEDFMPTDGTDVKVYTVGPDYAHAEARKSPALDGKVERDSEGKEIRYPVILSNQEKLISRKVCLAFKQTVCGFDLLRASGKSFVCDVNGFSFVKNSNKYYDDCAKILGNMILRELAPTLHIPWSVPFQLDDPPIVPTTFGKMMELRCVVAVIRHGDRTPKQKMKVEVRHPKFFEIFEKYDGYKHGHVKLKRPKQLQEILDTSRALLADIHTHHADPELEEKQGKLEQLKSVLEMYGHFSGINRKVQMKYQPMGRPRGSSSDDGNSTISPDAPGDPSLVLILKWGGELTPAGRIQAEELGRIFRCMYPGGQGRHIAAGDFLAESGSFDWESTRNTPSRPTVTPSTTTKISVINKLFNNFSPFSHKEDTDQSTTPRDIIPQHMTPDLATISEPLYDVFPTVPAKPQNQPIIPTYNVKPSEIALVDGNSPPMSKNSENSEKDTNSFKQEVGSDILEEIFTSAIPEDMKFDESDADECRSLSNIDPMIDWRFLPSCSQVKITETTSTKTCEDSLKSAKKLNEVLLKSYEIAVQTVNSLEIELSESRIASKHLNDTISEAINIINKLNSKRSVTNLLILKSSLRLVEYERTLYDVISNHLKINRDLYRVTKISKKPDCNAVVFELSKFSEKLRILLTSRIALTGSKFEIIDYDGVDINMLA